MDGLSLHPGLSGSANFDPFGPGGGATVLNALTFSATNLVAGIAASGTILGATALSTVTADSLPTGATINGAARTWAWDGSGSAGTPTVTLREVLAGAANTPRISNIGLTITANIGLSTRTLLMTGVASGTVTGGTSIVGSSSATLTMTGVANDVANLPTVDLTLLVGLETWPIQVQADIEPGYEAGDELELRFATTYANLLAGIYAGGGQLPLGTPPYDFGLAAVTGPALTYIRARVHRGASAGAWSDIIMHGDADAPTFTAGPSYGSVAENTVFNFNVTTNVETTIAITGGADVALFSVDNPTAISTSHAITMSAADFEASGATADVQFQITNLALVPAAQNATVTITDQDEIPNAFTFTDQGGVARSTLFTSNTITINGLGVTVPVTITGGEYSKNGGAFTSAAGTATNGDTFAVRHTSSASYSTPVNTTLTVGGGLDTFTTTTEADPAVVSFAAVTTQPANQNIGFATNVITFAALDFPAGRPVVFSAGGLAATRYITNVTVDGIAATRVLARPASDSDTIELWIAPTAAAGTKDVVITANVAVANCRVLCGSLVNAGSITPSDTKYVDPGYGGYGVPVEPASDLTIPASGLGLVCFTNENALSGLNAGLTQVAADPAGTPQWHIATMNATGRPGFSMVSGGFVALLAASFSL